MNLQGYLKPSIGRNMRKGLLDCQNQEHKKMIMSLESKLIEHHMTQKYYQKGNLCLQLLTLVI